MIEVRHHFVARRMIPFFGASALPDYRERRFAVGASVFWVLVSAHATLTIAGLDPFRFAVDLPLAVLAFYQSHLWQLRRSIENGLLAMLHLGFLWLGIAATLYAIQDASAAAGVEILGHGPLHALGIGFIGSMMMAMAARVTLGHSGHKLVAERWLYVSFGLLQAAAVLRIAGSLPALNRMAGISLSLIAGWVWIAAFVVWTGQFGPMLARARIDGKPG